MSLRTKISASSVAILVLTLAVALWFAHSEIEHVLRTAATERIQGSATQLAEILDESARRSVRDPSLLTVESASRDLLLAPTGDSAAVQRARATFEERLGRMRQTVAVDLWSRDGTRLLEVATPDAGARRPPRDALLGATPHVTDSAVQPRVRRHLTPLHAHDGSVRGELVSALLEGRDTLGYLVITSRASINRSSADQVERLIGPNTSVRVGDASGNVWFDLTDTVALPAERIPLDTLIESSADDGTPLLGVAHALRVAPWTVWVRSSADEVLAPAGQFVRLALPIAFALLLLSGGLVWLLAGRLTRPLAALTSASERIADGDYTARAIGEGEDDVGRLARSFNRMAEEVEQASRELSEHSEDLRSVNRDLRESEQRYRELVDLLPDAIVLHRDARILLANRAAAQLFGVTADGLSSRPVSEFVQGDGKPDAKSEGRDGAVRRADGSMRAVETASTPITIDGEPATLMMLRDVSEQRRLAQRLQQSEKMEAVGRLAGGIAHDFNNLLTVITSYGEILVEEVDAPAHRADLQEVLKASNRAAELTRQLLAFSRQQVLHAEVLSLDDVVASMERMLRRLIPASIEFTVALARTAALVKVDRVQLEQVVMNLALNARDAMPDGGHLRLETSDEHIGADDALLHVDVSPGAYAVLTVSDTGVGMTAAEQAHMFEPFYTTKEPGRGTGLGLATVYGIVQQSGGYISVYSEPGIGTVFRVLLPCVGAPAVARSGSHRAIAEREAGESILLLEDESAVREATTRVLERAGYRVHAVPHPKLAIECLEDRSTHFDLLLTDVVLPEMSGHAVATIARDVRPQLAVLFMSGYVRGMGAPATDLDANVAFIQKPFTSERLIAKVRETLDTHAVSRSSAIT